MKRPVSVILTAGLLIIIAVGCDKPAASKQPPAESFKTFAASFHLAAQQRLHELWDGENGDSSMKMCLVLYDKYEIDVKKTDSVISPYTGIIQLYAQQADMENKSIGVTWRFPMAATFAYQDEKWLLKSVVVTDDGFSAGDRLFFKSDLMQASNSPTVRAVRQRLLAASEEAVNK